MQVLLACIEQCDNVHMIFLFKRYAPGNMLIAWLCSFMLCGCQPASHQAQAYVFGTLVEIQIDDLPAAQAQAASDAVLARYQQLHQQLHAWLPGELTTLNTAIASGNAAIRVSPALASILSHARQLAIQSHGLFNPALGQLIALWGFHKDSFQAMQVDAADIARLLQAQPQMASLEISGQQVHSHNPAVQIDLGGYAKGYALEEGSRILHAHGVNNALINIGGNVMALGQHHGRPWRVGIQHPRQPGALAALALPSGWAIGTSGDYQRYFIDHGVRYCHILDPRTGKPAHQSQAVTVLIAPQAHAGVLSDVASKPLFIDPAHAATLAHDMQVEAWLLVTANGNIQLNKAMQQRLQWLDKEAAAHAHVVE